MKDFFELLVAMFIAVLLVMSLPILLLNDVRTINV